MDRQSDTASFSPLAIALLQEEIARIRRQMKRRLSGREQLLMNLIFGLNGERIHTQTDVGREFDISRERVRQLLERSLKRVGTTVDQMVDLVEVASIAVDHGALDECFRL
jgi:RNA polymerase primary sigma factor